MNWLPYYLFYLNYWLNQSSYSSFMILFFPSNHCYQFSKLDCNSSVFVFLPSFFKWSLRIFPPFPWTFQRADFTSNEVLAIPSLGPDYHNSPYEEWTSVSTKVVYRWWSTFLSAASPIFCWDFRARQWYSCNLWGQTWSLLFWKVELWWGEGLESLGLSLMQNILNFSAFIIIQKRRGKQEYHLTTRKYIIPAAIRMIITMVTTTQMYFFLAFFCS